MRVLGIVAEYNPFHDGHLYHLTESKTIAGAGAVVVCMSGNFVQRGEPAVYDKWERAKTAIEKGADLVIELPTPFATGSAETFAIGAMEIFRGLGIIDAVSFGSEVGSVGKLADVASVLAEEPEEFRKILREELDRGESFPRAREEAVKALLGEDAAVLLREPNNILGIEYIKAAKRLNFNASFVTVPRKGASHLETSSVLRRAMRDMNAERRYYDLLTYKLILSTASEIERQPSGGEGLGNRLKNSVGNAENLDELILLANSKRYPDSRIRRLCVQTLLDVRDGETERPLYARVLALNDTGAKLIRTIKDEERNTIPILTNINKEAEEAANASGNPEAFQRALMLDIRAADLRNLIFNRNRYAYSDYRQMPFRDLKGE